MDGTWIDPLPPEAEAETISRIATEVRRRGLQVPALLAIECHAPLGKVAANFSVAFSPFLVPFLGYEGVQTFGRLAANRESLDRLILAIEEGPGVTADSGQGIAAPPQESN